MKSTAIRMFALPVMLAATVSFASAQEGPKAEAKEAKQDAKNAAAGQPARRSRDPGLR